MDEKGMRFSPKKAINCNVTCSAWGCKSYAKKDLSVRFHCVPKAGEKVEIINKLYEKEIVDRQLIWMRRLKISKSINKPKVCSLHFVKEDYEQCGYHKNKLLKKTAVPSVNLPVEKTLNLKKIEENSLRNERLEKRNSKRKLESEMKGNGNTEVDGPKKFAVRRIAVNV